MRRASGGKARALVLGALAALALTAYPAFATQTLDVCVGGGCTYSTIQSAIDAAQPGDTVAVAAGTYAENVVVDKRILLVGQGTSTIVSPASGWGISITATGSSGTDRLVLRDLRVTGASEGIVVSSASALAHLTFSGITATANSDADPSSGVGLHFRGTGSISDVVVADSVFSANSGAGIRIATAVPSFEGLEVIGTTISGNGQQGFSYNPSATLSNIGTDFSFIDTALTGNNTSASANVHEMSLMGFHGDLTLQDVDVTASGAAYGILMSNAPTRAPTGTVVLDGVTVGGTVGKGALSFQYYSDTSGVALTDVDLSAATAPWGQFILDSTDADSFPLGSSTLKSVAVWSTGGVDATSATFLDASTGVELNRASAADGWKVADQVGDKIDLASLGLVRWKAGEIFVTPGSYAAPYTTAPSVQRAVDAASSGDTVRVKAGSYTGDISITKALTLVGAKSGVPAGPASSPAGRTVSASYAGESVIQDAEIRIFPVSPGTVTVDGFVIIRSSSPIYLDGSLSTTIKNNILIVNGGLYTATACSSCPSGIVKGSSNADATYRIENNRIIGGGYGIQINEDTAGSTWMIAGNYFSTMERGIQTFGSMNAKATYEGNRIVDVWRGIRIAESYPGTVVRNNSISVRALASASAIECGSGASYVCESLEVYGNHLDIPAPVSGTNSAVVINYVKGNLNRVIGNRFSGSPTYYLRLALPQGVTPPEVDATGNVWDDGSANAAAPSKTSFAAGSSAKTSPYISEYGNDPLRSAEPPDPGFWPNPVTLAVVCDSATCTETVTVANIDLGVPSVGIDLVAGDAATVVASDDLPISPPSPGAEEFAASLATFIDIAVNFTVGDPPPYYTVCVDGAAPKRLWHYEDPDDYAYDPHPGTDDPEDWWDITGRQLPMGTLTPITGRLCGMVVDLSPFAIASLTVPTTTVLTRTTGTTPSAYGSALVFTATVTPDAGVATGTIELWDAAPTPDVLVDTCTLSGGSCTFSGSSLTVGTYSFYGKYLGDEESGDDMEASQSSEVAQVILTASLELTVTGSQTYGTTSATFDATYTPVTGVTVDETGLTCTAISDNTVIPAADLPAGAFTLKTSTCSGATLSGANSGNYSISYTGSTYTVNAAALALTVTGSQTYGTTSATFDAAYAPVTGVTVDESGLTCTAISDDTAIPSASLAAGGSYTLKTSTCSGATLSGANSGNYSISYTGSTYTVNAAALALTVTGSQTYGTTSATFDAAYTPVTGVTVDESGLTCTALTDDTVIPSAGLAAGGSYTLKTSTCSGATLSGANSGNYTPSYTGSTYTVAIAATTTVYTGQTYDADLVGTSTLSVSVTAASAACFDSPAAAIATVTAIGGTAMSPLTMTLSGSGTTRTYSVSTSLGGGIYEIDVAFTPADGCGASSADDAVLTVVQAGQTANGGGWYRYQKFPEGSPRVNFGFSITRSTSRTGVVSYRGQLLWMNNGQWRLAGTVASTGSPYAYGVFTSTCPAEAGTASDRTCASFRGTGTLQWWNGSAWEASSYGPVTFTVTVYDGGTSKVTVGKKTTTVQNPDWFGIQIDPVPGSVIREGSPIQLMGGSIRAA